MRSKILRILFVGLWITFFEFLRNQIILLNIWEKHFKSLGLSFETKPINGILWMIWSITFAYIIYELSTKYSFYKTLCLSWIIGFVLMWITIYNLQVLPLRILFFAIPLSLLEVLVAYKILNTKVSHES